MRLPILSLCSRLAIPMGVPQTDLGLTAVLEFSANPYRESPSKAGLGNFREIWRREPGFSSCTRPYEKFQVFLSSTVSPSNLIGTPFHGRRFDDDRKLDVQASGFPSGWRHRRPQSILVATRLHLELLCFMAGTNRM
ncbi:hypothetical protein MFFC18_27320 [Mariniblastus fucicola]|uniref:Uncharacterized protein n=1 Tax=Mariniblastus fucicola TaxID=980251 RepID=A0A5B9P840_9BACT|nr:hypothetical protein MFFC18_27320 [Mariniblastus fucicola]